MLIDLIISLLVLSIPILLELRKRQPNLFEPILLFNYGFFASYFLKGMLIEWRPDLFITYPDRWSAPADLTPYFIISWFALTAFNLGYYYCPTPFSGGATRAITPSSHHRIGYLLLILVSVASSLSIVLRIKFDLASLLYSVAAWEDFRSEVMLSWLDGGFAFIGPIFVGFFHLGYEVHARPHGLAAERFVVAVLTAMVMLIIGSRALLLTWILSLLLYRIIWVKPMPVRLQGALLAAFPLAGGALGIIQKITTVGADSLQYPFPLNIFYRLSSSYEQFENLINIMHARFQFDWGRSIFEDVFLTFLPRALYASKPIDYGFMRAQNLLFGDWWEISRATTYPVGIVAELYFNFGYPGIFIGMLALGALLYLLRWVARTNALFIAPFCAIGASFLGPQRWYGAILMTLGVYLAIGVLCSLIGAFLDHLSDRIASARQVGERF
ncbi:hypothetical protein BSN85_34955 [Bradyrhizobium brasilense]|uniref:hypothetical protein n=1 Tax=Bradyrhizobium brasilense TaxID=1419277 RepID=UPI00097774F4|nr:hypothetical protein [Bradyrhizobium brasilense]OMI00268.1 hypothetical protein BSN85_34955 [Bradyrhizobium brasilense]